MSGYEKDSLNYLNSIADDAIKDLKNGATWKSVSEKFEVKRQTLSYFLMTRKGFVRNTKKRRNYNKVNNDILISAKNMYESNEYTIAAIARNFNVDRKILSTELKNKYGLAIRKDGKKQIDSSSFERIDTEEKAYWLGFLFADGYISNDGAVELCLKYDDVAHLKKYKIFLKSSHEITEKDVPLNGKIFKAVRISFKDKTIYDDLVSYGCVNNKSSVIQMPDLDSDQLRHFIRGFFDGDGCVSISKTDNVNVSFTSGSLLMLNQIAWFLRGVIDISFSITRDKRTDSTYKLYIASDSKYKFLNYIYESSNIYLDRKYNLFIAVHGGNTMND